MLNKYFTFHALRLFFEDYHAYEAFCGDAVPAVDRQLYEDLFYGTNADIYVPVWASACKTGMDILLNEVTLDVIKTYKAHGYAPAGIDGNPADFLGEQYRYLEYLAACALNGSMEQEAAEEAIHAFTRDFLVDTARCAVKGIEEYDQAGNLSLAKALMLTTIEEQPFEWVKTAADAEALDSYAWTKQPPLPVEKPHRVSVASFSDCGSKCKMLATVAEGCVLETQPDCDGTRIRFTGCPRGLAYRYTFLTSRRLRFPMKRIGARGEGRFRRITWEEAVTETAQAIRETREQYGPGSRFVISASAVCAAMRGDTCMKNLLAMDGGSLDFYNFYSAACAVYITPYVYGSMGANHISTYENSNLLILWGYNVSDGHNGFGVKETLMRAREKGAKIVCIDPRESDTMMSMGDQWIPIRPGSDAALADAMAYVIYDKGLQDQAFIDKFCLGFDEDHMPEGVPYGESYHSYLFGVKDGVKKTPAWAEAITGIPAQTIEDLAVEFATKQPAAILAGLGPQRTQYGEQWDRCVIALSCLVGSPGRLGGGTGAWQSSLGHEAPYLHRLPNPYPGFIPLFGWTRAIDEPETMDQHRWGLKGIDHLDSGIKLLFSLGSGIMLNQHSDINDTMRILRQEDKLEHLIMTDLFMTPGSRFADLLLPGVSFFEVNNIVPPWSGDVYFLYNQAVAAPLFGGRFEYDWIREVAWKLGYGPAFDEGKTSLDEWLEYLYYQCRDEVEPLLPDYETFKEKGAMVWDDIPEEIAFLPQLREGKPFATPSGKIEIFSKQLYDLGLEEGREDDIPGIPRYIPNGKEGPQDPRLAEGALQLMSYHTKRHCHSQHDQNALLRELDPPALWINPKDAAARGIAEGDLVEIWNERGRMRIPAKVTERIVQGVISVSEGTWFEPDEEGIDRGGSINVLTYTYDPTPVAKGNPQQTNIACVRKVEE